MGKLEPTFRGQVRRTVRSLAGASGFRVHGSGFRVQRSGFRAQSSESRVCSVVQGSGCGTQLWSTVRTLAGGRPLTPGPRPRTNALKARARL
jgi:hypothetical protein